MNPNNLEMQKPMKTSHSTAGLLARVAKGVVSFVANIFPQSARKDDVRIGKVSQTTAIRTLYDVIFAAPLLLLFKGNE